MFVFLSSFVFVFFFFFLAEPTGAGTQKQLLSAPNKGYPVAVDGDGKDRSEYYGETRCSLWACFGWNGLDRPKRFFGVSRFRVSIVAGSLPPCAVVRRP